MRRVFARRSPVDVDPPAARRTAQDQRAVPIEDAPLLATGRRTLVASPSPPPLPIDDYRRLLEALRGRAVVPFDALDAPQTGRGPFIGLRLDLTDGLTERAVQLAEIEEEVGVFSTKAISLVNAGDLAVFSEGEPRLDPRVAGLLKTLGVGPEPRFAILNELVDAFLASLACPWTILEKLAVMLRDLGVETDAFATACGRDPANDLNLLLLHHAVHPVSAGVLDGFGVPAAELLFPQAGRATIRRDLDLIERIQVEPSSGSCVRCRRLGGVARRWPELRVTRRCDGLATTGQAGWRPSPPSVADLDGLDKIDDAARVAIVCEPRHFADESSRRRSRVATPAPAVRGMPYPFHHFLAVNSDLDWLTPAQLESIRERFGEELALPAAGSFYLCAGSDHAVAANDDAVRRLHHRGAIDTLHAWVDTIDVVRLDPACRSWAWDESVGRIDRGGVLVSASTALRDARLVIRDEDRAVQGPVAAAAVAPSEPDNAGRFHAFFSMSSCAERMTGPGRHLALEGVDEDATLHEVAVVGLDPIAVDRAVDALVEDHVAPLLFTTHGGGRHVREYGNLHTAAAAERAPDEARHDLDRVDSPFHLLPALRRLGVRFVSPIGGASTPKLVSIGDLAQPMTLADGSAAWSFRRFLSRRHETLGLPERWAHGKNASHPAALGFQLRDILQRLHWLEPGCGGILYTHLGHNPGDQRCDRRAWTEEAERALETIAASFHRFAGDGAFRLWVATSASVLLYSVVNARVPDHLVVRGSDVRIDPWRDEALDVTVPDRDRFGTKLLHGVTVYVDDADAARVEIAGAETDCFVRNPPDESGRPSVTIVDDSAPRMVLVANNVIAARATGVETSLEETSATVTATARGAEEPCRVEWDLYPVPLDGATHWSFELAADPAGGRCELALRDSRGAEHVAGSAIGACWNIPLTVRGRVVLPLTPHDCFWNETPGGRVTGIRLRIVDGAVGASIRLANVMLLRPHPDLVDRRLPRILAGRVTCPIPADRDAWRVVVETPDGDRGAPVARDGSYLFRDLSPATAIPCRLEIGDRRLNSDRGRAAFTSSDDWAWDFHVRPGDLAS